MEPARPNAVGRWKHRLQKLRVSDRTLPRPDLLKLMQKYQ